MKAILCILFSCILFPGAFSQDVIYKKSGEKLDVKVIEITVDAVKYKPKENIDGPLRNLPIYEVYMIKYENGKEEFFKAENPLNQKKEKYFSNKKNTYFISIATGFGQSYGGIGIRFQGRIGKILGVGYHAGVGYFPEINGLKPAVWYSAGAKFFWYKGWYLDVQYGCVAQYKVYDHGYKYGTAYGPSILIGGDWFFNKYVGMNGALGTAFNVSQPKLSEKVYPTLDIGFVVKF